MSGCFSSWQRFWPFSSTDRIRSRLGLLREPPTPLFTQMPRETGWKIAEGYLTVHFWRQEASDRRLSAAFGGLRSFDSGLFPIFQTVSEGEFSELPLLGFLGSSTGKFQRSLIWGIRHTLSLI